MRDFRRAWPGVERLKERRKRKEERGSTKTRKSHGQKKVETKVGESCQRSELVNLHNPCIE